MARELAEACTGCAVRALSHYSRIQRLQHLWTRTSERISPMINHLYLRRALVLPVLGFAGSVAHAQATTTTQTDPKKASATTTTTKPGAPAAVPVVPKASGRSTLPASDKIPPTLPTGSAPASDVAQKK